MECLRRLRQHLFSTKKKKKKKEESETSASSFSSRRKLTTSEDVSFGGELVDDFAPDGTYRPKPKPRRSLMMKNNKVVGEDTVDHVRKMVMGWKFHNPVSSIEDDEDEGNPVTALDEYEKAISDWKTKGVAFEDPTFPAKETAICEEKEQEWKRGSSGKPLVNKWLRPMAIVDLDSRGDRGKKWAVLRDPQPSDVGPFEDKCYGDCLLSAALLLLADRAYRGVLNRMIVTKNVNPSGVYIIRLFSVEEGRFTNVVVDDKLPCDNLGRLVFGKGRLKELWIPLVIKAMAKLLGSYHNVVRASSGFIMMTLTGFWCEDVSISEAEGDGVWERVFAKRQCLRIARASGTTKAETKITGNHCYAVMGLYDDFDCRLVKLRNPTGFQVWTGDYHPHSSCWTEPMRQKYRPTMCGAGVFYMSWKDFLNNFSVITICHLNKKPRIERVKVSQNENTPSSSLDLVQKPVPAPRTKSTPPMPIPDPIPPVPKARSSIPTIPISVPVPKTSPPIPRPRKKLPVPMPRVKAGEGDQMRKSPQDEDDDEDSLAKEEDWDEDYLCALNESYFIK